MLLPLLWLLSSEVYRDHLLPDLEQRYPVLEDLVMDEPTAIVVLGGGMKTHTPEYAGADILSSTSLQRTFYAAWLAKHLSLPVVVTGGSPRRDDVQPEALLMRQVLVQLGIEGGRIQTESEARDTWENAVLTAALLNKQGIYRVVLVTTAIHMPRSVWSFQRQGLKVIAAPCDYRAQDPYHDLRSYLPRAEVLHDVSDGLHELIGLWWYRWHHAKDAASAAHRRTDTAIEAPSASA